MKVSNLGLIGFLMGTVVGLMTFTLVEIISTPRSCPIVQEQVVL